MLTNEVQINDLILKEKKNPPHIIKIQKKLHIKRRGEEERRGGRGGGAHAVQRCTVTARNTHMELQSVQFVQGDTFVIVVGNQYSQILSITFVM